MRTWAPPSILLVTAALVGCGQSENTGNDTDAVASRFEELVFVDKEGVQTSGNFSGFVSGPDWESTDWLTQEPDPAKQVQVSVAAVVEDFEKGTPVANATVDIWFDDVVDTSVDLSATSDNNGVLTVDVPACTKTAYRVTTDPVLDETRTTYKAHNIYPFHESGSVDGGLFMSVSTVTYQLIPTILGVTVDPDKAIIAGTAYDLTRDPATDSDVDAGKVEGAQIVVYDANGNIPDSLVVNYFTQNFPDRDQRWTSKDGLWVASNVPAGELRVEMWGHVDGELRLLGASTLLSEASSINIANLFAGYGDGVKYPEDCLAR